jgi:hypothetical protein
VPCAYGGTSCMVKYSACNDGTLISLFQGLLDSLMTGMNLLVGVCMYRGATITYCSESI